MSETGIDWPALLALEGQATAGPWDVDATGRVYDEDGTPLLDTRDGEGNPLGGQTRAESQANAEFVAEVRGAFPALVALVRGLAGALDDAAHRFGEIFEAARGEFIQSAATSGEQAALMALATIPAALRAGVGDGE